MKPLRFVGSVLTAACMLLAATASAQAPVRTFIRTSITLKLVDNSIVANFWSPLTPNGPPTPLTTVKEITDGAFVNIDLNIVVPDKFPTGTRKPSDSIRKMGEQSYRDESAGCAPATNNYKPLEMDDGLRYFFYLPLKVASGNVEQVRGEIYPGNRSAHYYNNVSCEYDPNAGGAVFRVTGFYYVIQGRAQDGVTLQLRPVALTQEEAIRYLVPAR